MATRTTYCEQALAQTYTIKGDTVIGADRYSHDKDTCGPRSRGL